MNKMNIISTLLYVIAVISFFGYLITKESGFMAAGGLFMIGGGMTMIMSKKKK